MILIFWFFCIKAKERTQSASSQKNRYEHQIQYQNQLFLYLHFQLFLFNLPYFSIGKENCCLGGTLSVEVLFDLHIVPILIYYGLRQIEFRQVVLQIAGKHLVHVVVETHMQGVVVAIA